MRSLEELAKFNCHAAGSTGICTVAFVCTVASDVRAAVSCKPEVCASVKRGLTHGEKRPTVIGVPELRHVGDASS